MIVVRTCSCPPCKTKVPLCALLLLPVGLRLATEKLYSPAAGALDRAIASSRRTCLSGWARMTHSIAGTVVGIGASGIDLFRFRRGESVVARTADAATLR